MYLSQIIIYLIPCGNLPVTLYQPRLAVISDPSFDPLGVELLFIALSLIHTSFMCLLIMECHFSCYIASSYPPVLYAASLCVC